MQAAAETVELQRQKLEKREPTLTAKPEAKDNAVNIHPKSSNTQFLPLVIIVVCVGIIAARQLLFSTPGFVPVDDETRARQLSITSFAECIQIFVQIGQILARGNLPNDSLSCDASGQANLITQTGNDVIVEHPQPDFYGYSRIYVSRNNPEPTVID